MSNTIPPRSADGSSNEANTPKGDNKKREGPEHLSPHLDDKDKWSEVASEPGYQKGHQGGYKGSADDAKFEQINDRDLKRQPAGRSKGDDDGRKTPLKQNERTVDKRESD